MIVGLSFPRPLPSEIFNIDHKNVTFVLGWLSSDRLPFSYYLQAGTWRYIGKRIIFICGGARDTSSEVWLITKSDWLKMHVVIIILSSMIYTICTHGRFQMGKIKKKIHIIKKKNQLINRIIQTLRLFSFFINELVKELKRSGLKGIQLSPNDIEILLLMFADDIALLSETVNCLQLKLKFLPHFCLKSELKVNTKKLR